MNDELIDLIELKSSQEKEKRDGNGVSTLIYILITLFGVSLIILFLAVWVSL